MGEKVSFDICHDNGVICVHLEFFAYAPNPQIKKLFRLTRLNLWRNAGTVEAISSNLYAHREVCRQAALDAKKEYTDSYQAPGWKNGTLTTDKKLIKQQELSNKKLFERVKKRLAALKKIDTVCKLFDDGFGNYGYKIKN